MGPNRYFLVTEKDEIVDRCLKAMGCEFSHVESNKALLNDDRDESGVTGIVCTYEGFEGKEVELTTSLRRKYPFSTLVVVIETQTEPVNVAALLSSGIDDVVVRGDFEEAIRLRLDSRIYANELRMDRDVIEVGGVCLNRAMRTISKGVQKRNLSVTEMNLLHCLAVAKGSVVEREVMKRRCWGGNQNVSDNALNRKLHEVRRALKDLTTNVHIKTVYGTGFVLEVDSATVTSVLGGAIPDTEDTIPAELQE